MINVQDISKRYHHTVVLDHLTLTIPAGGITSIIGPNGAGKSTLLSVISRLLPATSGQVWVDGLDVAHTPSDVLARRLAVLRQDNHLATRLTVRDLVGFGRYPHSKGRLTTTDQQHIERALGYLGLEPLADRFLDELSGGQRQRAFVAMVLCQDTDYILLDEPLNNLDIKYAVGMMRLMRQMVEELGKTIVLVIHDINFASCYSDYLIAMKDGHVRHHGSPAELMHPDVLRDLYDIDIDVQQIGGHRVAIYYNLPESHLVIPQPQGVPS